jgi:hypothetical protein
MPSSNTFCGIPLSRSSAADTLPAEPAHSRSVAAPAEVARDDKANEVAGDGARNGLRGRAQLLRYASVPLLNRKKSGLPSLPVQQLSAQQSSEASYLADQTPAEMTGQHGAQRSPEAIRIIRPTPRVDIIEQFRRSHRVIEGRSCTCLSYIAECDPRYEHSLDGNVDSEGTLGFNIMAKNNKDTFGTGTDMFIGLMNRYQRENIEIKTIRACWDKWEPEGTNTKQYLSNLRAGQPPEMAAKNTWTGRRAAQFGYTDVKVTDTRNDVIADFTKPTRPMMASEGQK